MPRFLSSIFTRAANPHTTSTQPVNRYAGFTPEGRVVVQDRRGSKKAGIPDAEEKGFDGASSLAIYRPSGAKQVDAAKAMANFTGWTYAAVNAIASEVANVQLRLYKITGTDHEEQTEHPLLQLIDSVNPEMTGTELKYTIMAHLELTGNCYWLLDGVRDETTPPRAIYPLNPGRVQVKLDKSSFPYKISHYEFTLDGKVYSFQPYQILHMKYPDPNDPFVGIGIPQTIPSWIDSDNYAMEYNRKYFLNGAGIGLYLATQTNVEGQIERIKQGFKDVYSGVENAHKTPVLPKGVDLKHTGVTHKDMDFSKLTDATRDRILAAFRVSKTILGTAESDTNRATAETADYVFSKRTIKPKMLLVVSYLNEFLVPRYGDDLYLTFIDPVPEDKEFRTKEMQAVMGNAPVMTANEARKTYMGLGPIEGGDQLMRPATLEPIGTTATPEGEDMTPQLAKAKTVDGWPTSPIRVRTGGKTAASGIRQLTKALSDAFKKRIDAAPEYQVKSVNDMSHEEYRRHWKRFADRSERAEADLTKIFKGINEQQKEQVLASLPEETEITKSLDELFDLKEWISITVDLVTPILTQLSKDEAAAALAMVGADQRDILADEQTRQALDAGIAKMAKSYNETTLDQLKTVIGEKLNQEGGTNLNELIDAVDGVYSFADERRAGLIAKTESFRAANWANKQAWNDSGVVKTVMWYTAEDTHVCQFCNALDGTVIPIEQNFFNEGDTITGTEGKLMTASYGDVEAPPLHPDCRCYIRPETIE